MVNQLLHLVKAEDIKELQKHLRKHGLTAKESQLVLGAAIAKKSLPIVRLLVEHGADVNARSKMGRPPLVTAVDTNDMDMVVYLLKQQPDLHLTDQQGYCAFAHVKSLQMAQFLFQQHKLSTKEIVKCWLFISHRGKYTVASWLLEKYKSLVDDIVTHGIVTTFIHGKYWSLLFSKMKNINTFLSTGETPLTFSTGRKDHANVEMLLDKGARLYMRDKGGNNVMDVINQFYALYAVSWDVRKMKTLIDKHIKKHRDAQKYLLTCYDFVHMFQLHQSLLYGLPFVCVQRILDFMEVE
jgi:ankyrin repeat protein